MVILIDTNVALDFLTVRQPFYPSAKAILQSCASDDVQGYIAFHSLPDIFYSFCSQLHALVQEQETRYRESVEVKTIDYLALVRDLYKHGSFRVAKGIEDFNPNEHDGLIYYECLCLRGKCLDKKIKHIRSSLSLDDCLNNLLAKDALKRVRSKNTVQINGTGGKRFYAIRLPKLR